MPSRVLVGSNVDRRVTLISLEEDEDDDDWTHRAAPSTFFFIPIYNLLIVVDLFSLASLLGCGFLTPLLVVLLGGGGGGGGGGIPIGKTMGVFCDDEGFVNG